MADFYKKCSMAGIFTENLQLHTILLHFLEKSSSVHDFVAIKNDRTIYIQSAYILTDEDTIKREYSPLDAVNDNYEKIVVSLDDLKLPSKEGIIHIQAWDLLSHLQ